MGTRKEQVGLTDIQQKRPGILHVATLNKPIGLQDGYGPIETVIHGIDKGLHGLGYRSVVACSSDSLVTGEKYETVARTLGGYCTSDKAEGQARIEFHLSRSLARSAAGDIDIVHMHEWYERVYTGRFSPPVPIVMTLHVPAALSGMAQFRDRNPSAPLMSSSSPHFVAISEHQRRHYSEFIPVAETIPHGIDVADYEFGPKSLTDGYLFNIGRFTEVKGQDTAIEVARKSGKKLILAGCVQDKAADRAFFARLQDSIDLTVDVSNSSVGAGYYDRVMKPILAAGAQTIYIGELNGAAKKQWYRHALATIFPIRWGEPFGMVLIESMASGTPVVAFREGAVPEIVVHGETGFIVDSTESMIEAVGLTNRLDRRASREHVERSFSIDVMAARYAMLYERLAGTVRNRAGSQPAHVLAQHAQRQPALAAR